MKNASLLVRYSIRLVRRQWRRFVLPFLSLTITGVVLLLVLLLTSSGAALIAEEARSLQGGDVVLESARPFAGDDLVSSIAITPQATSEQLSFGATIASENATAPFTLYAVDESFPLYGEFRLAETVYAPLAPNEILLDQTGVERLGVASGEILELGAASFVVKDVVLDEPLSLFGAFSLFPRAYISQAGFARTELDPALLRVEYRYAIQVPNLTSDQVTKLRMLEDEVVGLDIDIAGQDERGLQFGLQTISNFLVVAVLITAVLAAVNVYASTLYLITIERKSLAVLLALGMRRRELVAVLGLSLSLVVAVACGFAILFGVGLFQILRETVFSIYEIALPAPPVLLDSFVTLSVLFGVMVASFIPAVQQTFSFQPREILLGADQQTNTKVPWRSFVIVSTVALVPLFILATVLLRSVVEGVLVLGSIVGLYVVVAWSCASLLRFLYHHRARFNFFWRSIISQKQADGFFGIISLSSLFIALSALFTLTLLQVSLERFLVGDLAMTVPSTYVIDVQPSQKDQLIETFPELELFSNVGARIIEIDGLQIQAELEAGNPAVSRELGREFNLTARTELLASETVTAGAWSGGRSGELSVDEDFAEQANITLGSTITFSIQGFLVSGEVTSLRDTDSRSGMPFFYFVLSPEDIGQFPSVYFGFANYDDANQKRLGDFLATNMANVSMIETDTLGPIVVQIISTLLVLVLVVTLPPLCIATLLISTLIVSGYAIRRRVMARLRALGATQHYTFRQYLSESLFITVLASAVAYIISVAALLGINHLILELDRVVFLTPMVLLATAVVIGLVAIIAWYLVRTDTMPLRELVSYE